MTDRELLIQIYGMATNGLSNEIFVTKRSLKDLIEKHFNESPTVERLALEDRVRTLEKIVTSRGYQIDDELAATT